MSEQLEVASSGNFTRDFVQHTQMRTRQVAAANVFVKEEPLVSEERINAVNRVLSLPIKNVKREFTRRRVKIHVSPRDEIVPTRMEGAEVDNKESANCQELITLRAGFSKVFNEISSSVR